MNLPIINPAGERLDYSFLPGTGETVVADWLVVLGHGVTGDKDRPLVVDTATALSAAGFPTLRISFSGNGASEGNFQASTITKEVADLGAVIDALSPSYPNIAYIGHSMGAAVGVLRAAQDERIRALVSLAGMVDTKAFAETEFGDITPDEGVMWDDEDCPLSRVFMSDLTLTVGHVSPAAEQVTVPWLLVHGTADDVVRPGDTTHIQMLKESAVDVVFVPGADHGFNAPDHKAAATRAVVDWLRARA